MKKYLLAVISCVFVSAAAQAATRTPFSQSLEKNIQARSAVVSAPGVGRLFLMRYFMPQNSLVAFNKADTNEYTSALARYLFNMYVSTAAYKMDVPSQLTLNQVGVLDSFYNSEKPLDYKSAVWFYKKHKTDIRKKLVGYFNRLNMQYDVSDSRNDARELAFVRLLAAAPAVRGFPGYYMASHNTITGVISAQEEQAVSGWRRAARQEGSNKVVTYVTNTISLDALDNKYARRNNMTYTYRNVNDECEYASYLTGKTASQELADNKNWSYSRVYKIAAYPVSGAYLQPASGSRFQLYNGRPAAHWQYHVAVLFFLYRNGRYVPLVSDSFLAGDKPVSLDTWLKNFRQGETIFSVAPYFRRHILEEHMKTPQKRDGSKVRVDGRFYKPHPIEP